MEEIDKKFLNFEEQLDNAMKEILVHTRSHLFEINEDSKNLQILEEQALGTSSQKKPEDLKKFKNHANDYIKKCEDLDSYLIQIKDFKLKELLIIKKKDILPSNLKLTYLKKYIKTISDVTWKANQKKPCNITQYARCMEVNYSSCWNDFHSTSFLSGEHEIYLKITNSNCQADNYTIGVTNENFNKSNPSEYCIGCQKSPDSWSLKPTTCFSANSTINNLIKIPTTGTIIICLNLNLDERTLFFMDEKGSKSEIFKIHGNEFKVTVGQCTSGSAKYEFVDGFE